MTMTNPTEEKQRARAELQVYLNRLRVIHGLTELDLLEVFNAVGSQLLRETLEDKAIAVAKPVQQINVKNDNTIVMQPVDQYGKPVKRLVSGIPGQRRPPAKEM